MNNSIKLPKFCFMTHPETGKTVEIVLNESGYFNSSYANISSDEMNKNFGITPEQVKAMEIGSMFGWDTPGAQL